MPTQSRIVFLDALRAFAILMMLAPPSLGNTPKVEEWRDQKALERTQKRRPDLLK